MGPNRYDLFLGKDWDWVGMRSLMVEEFREFDLDALEWAIRFKSISPTVIGNFPGYDDPYNWSAQPSSSSSPSWT